MPMEWQNNIIEYIFFLLIVLYFIFLYRYRRKIGLSKPVFFLMLKMEGLKESLSFWYLNLNKKRFLIKVLAILLLITGGVAIYLRVDPERRFNRLIEGCADLVEEKRYEQAIIDMSNALKIRPDYARGHYFLAFLYKEMGEMDKAEASLQRLIRIDPNYEDSVRVLADMLEAKRDAIGLNNLAELVWEERPADGRIIRAKALVLEGRVNDSHAILTEAIKINPGEAKIHILQGDLYVAQGISEKAMESYEKAIKIDYGLWQAHFGLARLYLEKGDLEEGLWELNATRSLNKDFTAPALIIAQVYMGQGETEKALTLLEDILEKNSGNEEAAYLLATAYCGEERFQEAVNLFSGLSEKWQKNEDYLYNLAFAYFRTGKYNESLEQVNLLEAAEKSGIRGLRLKALALAALGRTEESLAALRAGEKTGGISDEDRKLMAGIKNEVENVRIARAEAVKQETEAIQTEHTSLEEYLKKKDYASVIKGAQKAVDENRFKAPFRNLLGVAYLADNKPELAKEQFKLSYEENRANPAPLLNLVNIHIRERDLDKAENLLLEHSRQYEKEALTRFLLGKIYLQKQRLDDAMALFQRVSELDPDNYEPHQQMALIYRYKGDMKTALKEYEKSLNINPNDSISLNDAANIYADLEGNLNKGLEYATRARNIVPQNASVLDTLGYIYYLRGEDESALNILKNAYELNPHLPDIPFHLGQAQFRLKQYSEAEKSLRLALGMKRGFNGENTAKELLKKIEQGRAGKSMDNL